MVDRKLPKNRTGGASRQVAQFPPIPRVPPPPTLPEDSRQSRAAHVLGAIATVARTTMNLAGPNIVKGFHASAVDLGRLQLAMERGLSRFDDGQIEARWEEVFDWICRVIRSWVQRHKRIRIERRESGIRIALTTQDDLGYYEYAFDVFPRRGRRAGLVRAGLVRALSASSGGSVSAVKRGP